MLHCQLIFKLFPVFIFYYFSLLLFVFLIIKWKEGDCSRPVGKFTGWPRTAEASAGYLSSQIELRKSMPPPGLMEVG